MIFVDTVILIDVAQVQDWTEWSRAALSRARVTDALVTSAVVVAELAPRFAAIETELAFIAGLGIDVAPLGPDAAFCAGQAHAAYRRAGGVRTAILADFLIGAQAAAIGATLLTRDRARFAAYFPELPLLTPETD